MQLTVALEARYSLAPDGSVWSQYGMARRFWQRYLEVFDTVRIVSRARRIEQVPAGWLPVNGKNILFHGLPDYQGPWQYLRVYRRFQQAIRAAVPLRGAVILRGGVAANCLERELRSWNYPYALEVVGDPNEVFAPGVVDHPLRPFFRWYFSRHLRRQCLRAVGVAYVTKRALQQRYPARFMSVGISDVDLPEEAMVGGVRWTHYSSSELNSAGVAEYARKAKDHGPYQLVTVGSLAQLYKGTDVLIEAVARCVSAGFDLTAVIVGTVNIDGSSWPKQSASVWPPEFAFSARSRQENRSGGSWMRLTCLSYLPVRKAYPGRWSRRWRAGYPALDRQLVASPSCSMRANWCLRAIRLHWPPRFKRY
jgi:glycosyltransferase involved in cell wall biosynthesis